MSGWLSPQSLGGLAIALAVALVTWRNLYQGVQAFTLLASIPVLQVGAFSGANETQGLMMSEVLAMVLVITAVLMGEFRLRATEGVAAPLLVFLAVACVSGVAGHVWYDPAIDLVHLNAAVTVGQVLLFALPVGVVIVTASAITEIGQAVWIVRAMQAMTLVQPLMAFVSTEASVYLSWTWSFGLMAAPFSIAEALETPSWPRRLALVALALAPIGKAFVDGRAFVYLTLAVALGVVVLLARGRKAAVPLGVALCGYLMLVAATGNWMPTPVETLVDTERRQQSLGGRTGRGALFEDAMSIWLAHPVVGVGPGNSYPYMLRYSTLATPHNQYANLLLEVGALGLLAFVEFIRRALMLGLRTRSRAAPEVQWMVTGWIGLFAGLIVGAIAGDFMMHSIRNGGILFFTQFYQQWVLLGVVVAMHRMGTTQVAVDAPPARPVAWSRRVETRTAS
jgi:O-antigen ligase